MEHVFIARHGDYDRLKGNLTDTGIAQITGLAKQIKVILADQASPIILTSQSPRARESSEILKVTLSARVPEQCPYINNQFLREEDIANIDRWIDRAASLPEPLILVTHLPVLEKYIPHFAVKYLGRPQGEKWDELPKGGAYHFDLIAKTVQRLPNTNFLLPNRPSRQSLDSRVLEGNEDEETINTALQLASQERIFITDSDWALLRDKEYQPSPQPSPLQEPAEPPISSPLSQSVPVYSIARQTPLKKQFINLSFLQTLHLIKGILLTF